MQLQHQFTVPVPIERAWEVLNDVEVMAPCMPGAVLDEVRGKECDGRVKVKLGPIQVTYSGTATFVETDEMHRRLVVRATGKETRGSGTASATITADLSEVADGTAVDVVTDLAITGKPAQFARGVMVEVSNKLLGQFVDCLSAKITEPSSSADDLQEPHPASSTARPVWAEPEAIDLMGTAGAPVLKRVLPAVAAVFVLLVLMWRRR